MLSGVLALAISAATLVQTATSNRITVPGEPARGRCEIVLDSVVLSDARSTGYFGDNASFSQGRSRDIYVVSDVEPARILHFSSEGRFIQAFGRRGGGPGEYGYAVPPVITRGDTLNVFDAGRRRWTVLAPNGAHVRTMRLPLVSTPLALPDGRFVLNGNPGTREAAGYPLHVVDREGQVVASFGAETPALRPDMFYDNLRKLAVGPDGTIWSARINAYRLEEWTADGELRRIVEIEAPWFEPWVRMVTRPDSIRPQPLVNKIWWSGGRLWLITRVPDRAWSSQPMRRHGREGPKFSVGDNNRFFDTRIEVLDVANRQILASLVVDPYLIPPVDGTFLARYKEDEQLNPQFVIYRPRLISLTLNERGAPCQ